MSIRALIVDDEPLARERIKSLLTGEPGVAVVGECRDGREALQAVRERKPDLVFLDIQMPEMNGFEVLAELAPAEMPEVIFVTAYDQYAIKAFEVHALDYLLKPFDRKRFETAVSRAREHLEREGGRAVDQRILTLLEEIEARRQTMTRFVVRTGGRIFFLKVRDVECIEATGNYVRLYCGKDSHLIRETMASLEAKLGSARFARVHRSWIVNVERIVEFGTWFHGGLVVVMPGGRSIHVGRRYRAKVDALLGQTA